MSQLILLGLLIVGYLIFFRFAAIVLIPAGLVVGFLAGIAVMVDGAWSVLGPRASHPTPKAEVGAATDPALPSYPAVQSWAELAHLWRICGGRLSAWCSWVYQRHSRVLKDHQWASGFALPHVIGLAIGIGLASATGVALFVFFGVVAMTAWVVAAAVAAALRLADRVRARRSQVSIRCPNLNCEQELEYPGYRCGHCGQLHRDVRLWKLGVRRRKCACLGGELRPLIILGSDHQDAACPKCSGRLDRTAGTGPTIGIGLIGGPGSGKSTLIGGLAAALERESRTGACSVRAGITGSDRLGPLAAHWVNGGAALPTPDGPQSAIEIILETRRGRRTSLQLQDPSGASLAHEESLERLSFLNRYDRFIVVIDPLSIPVVAARYAAAVSGSVAPYDALSPPLVRIADVVRSGRAAVVLTRGDLIASELRAIHDAPERRARLWLESVGEGAIVRMVEGTFAEVRWFVCARTDLAEPIAVDSPLQVVEWLGSLGLISATAPRATIPVPTRAP